MLYANPLDLVSTFGATELAKLATPPEHKPVSAELLQLTINDESREHFSIPETLIAEKTVAAIQAAIYHAEQLINSYLAKYYKLPLTQEQILRSPLTGHTCDLVRYRLALASMGTPPEAYRQRHDDVIAWLRDISTGKASLYIIDAAAPTSNPTASLSLIRQAKSNIHWNTF